MGDLPKRRRICFPAAHIYALTVWTGRGNKLKAVEQSVVKDDSIE